MKIEVNIGKRYLIIVMCLLVLNLGALVVYAQTSNSGVSHDWNQITNKPVALDDGIIKIGEVDISGGICSGECDKPVVSVPTGTAGEVAIDDPLYVSNNMNVAGSFCLNGDCRIAWPSGVLAITEVYCSGSGGSQTSCSATCPSGYRVIAGGCSAEGSYIYLTQNIINGNGWSCASSIDYSTKYSAKNRASISGYAICLKSG